jgi:hypothetical protein
MKFLLNNFFNCSVRLFLLFTAIIPATHVAAQDNKAIETEINHQIWKPFKQSYESRNWQVFNNLHSDEVLRITDKGLRVGNEYKLSNKNSFERKSDVNRTIDFSFFQRATNDTISYEVGIYRITYHKPGVSIPSSYGQFHVVLKKINGLWKIVQDFDSADVNGKIVTEEDFLSGSQLKIAK